MTDCRFCGTPGAYDSGFTVECSNQACRAFSPKQASLVMASFERESDTLESMFKGAPIYEWPKGTEMRLVCIRGEWKVIPSWVGQPTHLIGQCVILTETCDLYTSLPKALPKETTLYVERLTEESKSCISIQYGPHLSSRWEHNESKFIIELK